MEIWTGFVQPEWIDYNGHMNVAYYHMAFDQSTDRFLEQIGLGEAYLAREPGSMFALEDHMTYQRELKKGDALSITLQLLDFDEKRLHYFLRMYHVGENYLAATMEHLSIFIDMRERRSAPMPPDVHRALTTIYNVHRLHERPEEVGRLMGIRRKS